MVNKKSTSIKDMLLQQKTLFENHIKILEENHKRSIEMLECENEKKLQQQKEYLNQKYEDMKDLYENRQMEFNKYHREMIEFVKEELHTQRDISSQHILNLLENKIAKP